MEGRINYYNSIEGAYRRSQNLMQGYFNRNIVPNSTVYPVWIKGRDCFWYEREINLSKNTGCVGKAIPKWEVEYRLVDAVNKTNKMAFDHNVLADSLVRCAGSTFEKSQLPIRNVCVRLHATSNKVKEVEFNAFDDCWVFDPSSGELAKIPKMSGTRELLESPDFRYAIFTKNYNLCLKDLATNEERFLTSDGEEDYCYSVEGNAWGVDMGKTLQACWSPDSKKIFTIQRDCRQVLTAPIVEHVPSDGSFRPKVHHAKISMQGDKHVPSYRLLILDIENDLCQEVNYPNVSITRNSFGFFSSNLGWWSNDSRHIFFIDLDRGYQRVSVIKCNVINGKTSLVFEENSDSHINLMVNADEYPTIEPLPETDELIWFSERGGWAHLYLYDLKTGSLKNTITSGQWVVRNILSVDKRRREVFLHTMGRSGKTRDPYYRDIVRVNIDSGEMTTIASSDDDYYSISSHKLDLESSNAIAFSNHNVDCVRSVSHSGNFVVATRSRADSIPVSLLLDRDGQEILSLERGDFTL